MENQENSQAKPVVLYVLIALLVLISGIGIFLVNENNKLKTALADCDVSYATAEDEKVEVMNNLQDMASEYDSLMTDNDSINSELFSQKEKVDKLMSDAKKYNWSIYKLKKEASTLREIMKGYVRTIDSLNTENVELRAENLNVKDELGVKQNENSKLKESNSELEDKVRLGAKLAAINLTVYAQRVKRNNVHKESTRASTAEKIKTCFTIDDNEVTEPGKKMVYLRIMTPEGTVLAERSDNSNTFDLNGSRVLYSVKKEVNYENKELDLCMYWDVLDMLTPGEYYVKAYIAGDEIGSSTMILK
jgi:peptidoglycan hydrolase CwlO-like protein